MQLLAFILFSFTSFVLSYKPRFCKNCKHFIPSSLGDSFGQCKLFELVNSDKVDYLVTGKKTVTFKSCTRAREDESKCGVNGTHYKAVYPLKGLEERKIIDM